MTKDLAKYTIDIQLTYNESFVFAKLIWPKNLVAKMKDSL